MTDSKTLLDSKTFFFWNDRLTSFVIQFMFAQKFFCFKAKIQAFRIFFPCEEKLCCFRCLPNCVVQYEMLAYNILIQRKINTIVMLLFFPQTLLGKQNYIMEKQNICWQGALRGRGVDYNKDENWRIELSVILWGVIVCVYVYIHSSVWKNKKYSEKSRGGVKRLTCEKERKH